MARTKFRSIKQKKRKGFCVAKTPKVRETSENLEQSSTSVSKRPPTSRKSSDESEKNTKVRDNRSEVKIQDELRPIFTRLSKDELLSRCLQGLTQNQNESVNGQLWARCPKNKFCGRHVEVAVCETVCVFNTGAASKAVLMKKADVQPGKNMLMGLRKSDERRVASAEQKVSKVYVAERKKHRQNNKGKADSSGSSYMAGGFGLESTPEWGMDPHIVQTKGKEKGRGRAARGKEKYQKRKR